MIIKKSALALLLSAAILFSCGKKETVLVPLSESNAIITGSIDKSSEKTSYHLSFKREALEQLFLMTMAEIEGAPTPTGSAWAPKIVFFEIKGNSMFMFESLDGKLSTNTIQTRALLAEFPIVSQTFDSVTVDFKTGMNHLFYKRSMYSSESGDDVPSDIVFKVTNSFIHKVEIRGNYLFIDQFVRLDGQADEEGNIPNLSTEIKYTFSTYKKNDNFEPRATNGQQRVGYFETYPVLTPGSGASITPIMKFDISKPVTYYYTRNVPETFKQAVIDGVLYWNRVFGKEVMKAEMLPEGISVHEPGYNIVQWLEWDTAGFAYANMMGDPLTGETLQSHVYMTSVFGLGGYARAVRLFKKYLGERPLPTDAGNIGVKGFTNAQVCNYHDHQSFMKDIGAVLAKIEKLDQENKEQKNVALTDEEKEIIFNRYAQDYVRQVVAHEVGHTLGLRHNFAGSLTTTIDPSIFETVSKVYFMTGKLLPGMIPSATVMDYTPSMISSMIGAFIRQGQGTLVYDKQAIDFGYSDEEVDPDTFVPFCTDGHKGKGIFHDCKIWDQFSNPIDAAWDDVRLMIESTAYKLALSFDFLSKKTAGQDLSAKIKKVNLDPRKDATAFVTDGIKPLFEMLDSKAQFIAIRNEFPANLGMFDARNYAEAIENFKQLSVKHLGGMDNVLFSTFKMSSQVDVEQLVLIDQITAKMNVYFGNYFKDLTDLERAALEKKITEYFGYFEREYLIQAAQTLAKVNLNQSSETFVNSLLARVEQIVFAKGSELITTNELGSVQSHLYDYKNEQGDLRGSMIALLKDGGFLKESPSFQRKLAHARADLLKRHNAEESILLNGGAIDDLSDQLYDWLVIEKKRFSPIK